MTPRTAPQRASLYVRLSKASDDRNLSRQGMADDLRKLCADRGFVEVALHVDDGKSGAVRNRPEFRAWLADAVEGRADVLVAWHVDRLSREGLNVAATILDVIEGKDPDTGKEVRPPVRLIGYDDRLDSSDGDGFRLNFVIKAELARAELARMKSRSQSRVRRMRAEKRSTGGLTPYGFQRAQRGPMELEHDPVSAPVLREAVRRVIDGASVASIARDLNDKGVLSPRDHAAMRDTGEARKDRETGEPLPPQRWTDETLRRMLGNEVLLGKLTDNGKVVRDSEGKPVLRGEPLISEDDWLALRAAINGSKRPKYRAAPDALLSGVAFCLLCGEPLHFHWAVKPERNQEYRYYRCSGRTRKGNNCEAGAPRAERLEEVTEEILLYLLGDLEIMAKRFVPGSDTGRELAEVEQTLSELRADRAAGLYRGERGTAEYREMYANLEARREGLEGTPSVPDSWAMISTGVTYRAKWQASDVQERRKLLLDSDIRIEGMKAAGVGAVSFGVRDRPDSMLTVTATEGVQVALLLPRDLAARVTGDPGAQVTFRQRSLIPGEPGRTITI
ncbi:recombinase family protein [Dactylosporangium sp. NBC_01737]|uniref:recombinase family protein n=1 Tax=Dactylosporangium sp. NBC_01737 TaxID=2975959 RepID=UPI002E12AF67|nr:recombinase family protein [Dactylosporangium sp. NBC_01737]